eukprot:CAMPEP_0202366546 /NCGR_PEP_ID=MMETSP1126-20121109/17115_1 /ASSEMBLY_ACC=CAM_ASM_000457 /TAXON_ID=3047 /ORGANISM="Dunaliella tertiolecta, Strain CCMP1320" /LENGTH=100 /DNA_ID=CAMNT_0048961619 /DNA_START=203 /DNA_END=506 /DNA_ORIENTATION=-
MTHSSCPAPAEPPSQALHLALAAPPQNQGPQSPPVLWMPALAAGRRSLGLAPPTAGRRHPGLLVNCGDAWTMLAHMMQGHASNMDAHGFSSTLIAIERRG